MSILSKLTGHSGGIADIAINRLLTAGVTKQQAIALGLEAGSIWTKNGYNGALSNSFEDLWSVGGTVNFPATAQQMEVISSSASDTSGGTGARTVEITYLDGSFVQKTTTVTLNGTTPVATSVSDIYRINFFRVKTVGTGGENAGDIDIRNLADTPIYSRIAAGTNRGINGFYTIPAGKTLYIFNILFSAGSNVANRPVRFVTKATYDNIAGSTISFFMPYTNVIITDGSVDVPIEAPTILPAGTDLKVSAICPDGAAYGAVTLRGWLI